MLNLLEMKWHYCGDVNLEHGGMFVDLSDWQWGYCNAVRVTDLDSACGFTGAVLIEHITINGCDDAKRIREALQSCYGGGSGIGARNWHRTGRKEAIKDNLRHAIADALASYGYTDPDDNWCGQWRGRSEMGHSEIVQIEQGGPMVFDGWKADRRITNTTLEQYVKSVHLND